MRNLLLAVVLVSWACAEGLAPPRQLDKAADATADATGEEAATLVQTPVDREQEAQRDDEQEEDPTPAPTSNFNYDEWTAALPTLGKPKIPGAPFPYLEDEDERGLYDRMRRLRWAVWEYERYVIVKEKWTDNWVRWLDTQYGTSKIGVTDDASKICSFDNAPYPLRGNDGNLRHMKSDYEEIVSKLEELTDVREYEFGSSRSDLGYFWTGEIIYGMTSSKKTTDTSLHGWVLRLNEMLSELFRREGRIFCIGRTRTRFLNAIKSAGGCPTSDVINICWHPVLHQTINNLSTTRCADQR